MFGRLRLAAKFNRLFAPLGANMGYAPPMDDDIAQEFSQVRNEFSLFRGEMADEFSLVRKEMADEFSLVRNEFSLFREEVAQEFSLVRNDIAQINQRLDRHDERFVQIDARFDRLDVRLDNMTDHLLLELKSFIDIIREEQRDQHRAFLDELRGHGAQLGDHEKRITKLERKKSA